MSGITFQSATDFLTITLTFFSSLLALVMFFKYLIIRDKTRGEVILCIFIFFVFIWRFSDGLEYSELYRIGIQSPMVFVVTTSVLYFFSGPLIYFYGKFYISTRADTAVSMVPHLAVPCLLSTVLISVAVFSSINDPGYELLRRVDGITVSVATALLCAYVLFVLIEILRLLIRGSMFGKNLLGMFGVIATLIIGAGLAYLFDNKLVLAILVLAALAIHLLFFDIITASLQIVQDEAERGHYQKSQIRDINVDEIIERIEIMMSWEKMYHDDRLSLNSFAERLGITPHQLSEILNAKIGLGFYPFINNYRIKEAREILERDKDAAIIKVAFQVGFNSLSSFYTSFKKITGMSPGSYQKFAKK